MNFFVGNAADYEIECVYVCICTKVVETAPCNNE